MPELRAVEKMWYSLRVTRKAILLAGICLLAVGAFALFRYRKQKAANEQPAPEVMIIGLDGASWNLMKGPLERGKLPNLKHLIETGVSGPLSSLTPTSSPILWTTIATSKTQKKHGIGSFTAEHEGKEIPVSGMQRATKAFWNIYSDYKVSVGLVNWWVTWPPEKIQGFVVSDHYRNWNPRKFSAVVTYPPELLKELPKVGITRTQFEDEARANGLPPIETSPNFPQVKPIAASYKVYWGHDRAVRESCRRLLASKRVQVFASVFRIVDVSSHLFWTWIDPQRLKNARTEEDVRKLDEEFSRFMEPVYVYADGIVGDFLQRANSRTNIIICSDHGFRYDQGRYGHSNMDPPPDGVIILNGPAFRQGAQIQGASILDITATTLYLKGIPVGKDMDGKVLLDAFDPDFRAAHAVITIPTHDKGWDVNRQAVPSEMDEEILKDLRSLGYIN